MGTETLRLLFIVALMCTVADLMMEEDYGPCSRVPEHVDATISDIRPKKYFVQLTILPDKGQMSGSVEITVQTTVPVNSVSLFARNLHVSQRCTRILWNDEDLPSCDQKARYRVRDLIICEEREMVTMFFANTVPVGTHVLHIEYSTLFEQNMYLLNFPYSWNGADRRWIVTNLYVPDATRAMFPSYSPTTQIVFQLAIKHNSSYSVFTNMPMNTKFIDKTTGLQWTLFTESDVMSFRFFGFAMISHLSKDPRHHTGLAARESMWHSPNIPGRLFNVLEDVTYYTMRFFYPDIYKISLVHKLDYIVLRNSPIKSASSPGLITYREGDVTYNWTSDFDGRMLDISKLVTYETTRQMLIREIGQNSDIYIGDWWQNEFLASYCSYQLWNPDKTPLFVAQTLQTALDIDILLERQPIMRSAKNDTGIDGLLYPLLYHKKAYALLYLMLNILGPRTMDSVLEAYVESKGLISLWSVLQNEYLYKSGCSHTIHEIMDSWLDEIHHPEMLFIRNYTANRVQYVQQNYRYQKWKIPVTYATPTDINFFKDEGIYTLRWYEGNGTEYVEGPDPHEFFLANVKQIGYYRVNYDKNNWFLLADALRNKQISISVNRAQIVSDAFYFASKGQLDVTTFFEVIEFLRNETDIVVWYPMFNIMSYMSTFFKCPESNSTGVTIKGEILKALDGLLLNLGYSMNAINEKSATKALRMLAIKWACKLGHAGCRNATAATLLESIHDVVTGRMPLWEAEVRYTTGMMTLTFQDWETILVYANKTRNQQLLEYLTYTENENSILFYLNATVTHSIKEGTTLNMTKIFHSILKKHAKKIVVADYMIDYHYDEIKARFPGEFPNVNLIGYVTMNTYSIHNLGSIYGSTAYHFRRNNKLSRMCNFFRGWRTVQLKRVLRKYDMFIHPMYVWYKHK